MTAKDKNKIKKIEELVSCFIIGSFLVVLFFVGLYRRS